jgi:hypothetical protein
MPMPAFATTMKRKSASRQSEKSSVSTPSATRTTLNGVTTFAITMLRVERLAGGSRSPRSAKRRSASACVSPRHGTEGIAADPRRPAIIPACRASRPSA